VRLCKYGIIVSCRRVAAQNLRVALANSSAPRTNECAPTTSSVRLARLAALVRSSSGCLRRATAERPCQNRAPARSSRGPVGPVLRAADRPRTRGAYVLHDRVVRRWYRRRSSVPERPRLIALNALSYVAILIGAWRAASSNPSQESRPARASARQLFICRARSPKVPLPRASAAGAKKSACQGSSNWVRPTSCPHNRLFAGTALAID